MNRKEIPVYTIDNLSVFNQKDILISRFAPYLSIHHNLHLPHKHSFYHLLLFTEGGGKHDIDFHDFPVRPYQIYFMVPGQVHSWSFKGHVDGYVINFSEQFFQSFLLKKDYMEEFSFLKGNVTEAVIDIPEAFQCLVLGVFEQLLQESERTELFGLDMVRTLILQLFYVISRFNNESGQQSKLSHHSALFNNLKKLIDANHSTIKLPKDYAALLFITPSHLNTLCNEMVGISAGELIRNRIILEAKRQLVNLDTRVSEIASKLNFGDHSNFTKFFKKQVGMGPEEFRKIMTEEIGSKSELLK